MSTFLTFSLKSLYLLSPLTRRSHGYIFNRWDYPLKRLAYFSEAYWYVGNLVNIGSDNTFHLLDTEPTSKLMLTCQLDTWEHDGSLINSKWIHFIAIKCMWKCCMQNIFTGLYVLKYDWFMLGSIYTDWLFFLDLWCYRRHLMTLWNPVEFKETVISEAKNGFQSRPLDLIWTASRQKGMSVPDLTNVRWDLFQYKDHLPIYRFPLSR